MSEQFESFVNSEEYQTIDFINCQGAMFESFVNSEEYQTICDGIRHVCGFESFVNSEEYQTVFRPIVRVSRLRALLIQKSIKQQSR